MSRRWPRRVRIVLVLILLAAITVFALFELGIAERWARDAFIQQVETATGARVEVGGFHLHVLRLHAEIDNLTVHGLEARSAPPLFHADHVVAGITILSFFHREFKLDQFIVEGPQITVRFAKDGSSNLPTPKVRRNKGPWQETLFNLKIGFLELKNGSVAFNDQRVPLAVKGHDIAFQLQYAAGAPGGEAYVGNLHGNQMEMDLRRDLPFRSDLAAKFTLHRNSFELDELIWKLPHSELNLRAELPSFAESNWNLRYRGRLTLADVRTIFRSPLTPDLIADFSGQARYASGDWSGSGHFDGHDIKLPYQWYHASNMETWGDFTIAGKTLVVEKLSVRALEGSLDGRLEMDLKTLAFRTKTHFHHASLADALAAVNNPDFPVDTLHWDGGMDIDSTNTWVANFKHFRCIGEARWSPPATSEPGIIPVTAHLVFDFSEDAEMIELTHSEITTPHTQIEMDGTLSAKDSALELNLKTQDLVEWDDFINRIRGVDAVPTRIAGNIQFRGRILGPLSGPTFDGHFNAGDAHFAGFQWDQIDGDLDYSLDHFRLTKATVRRGEATVAVDLEMQLDGDWSFVPGSTFSVEAETNHAPGADVQAMFGTNYPVTAFLTGTFRGGGTSAEPELDSNFLLEDIQTKSVHFDRLSGDLHLARDEVRLSRAELRRDTGRAAGDILYRPVEQTAEFNLAGTGILLDKIQALQNPALPIGGRLDFTLRGSGPIRAPIGAGDFRVVNLKIGADEQGDFRGRLDSDGKNVRAAVNSERSNGQLRSLLNVELAGDQAISGKLTVEKFDIDPLLSAGFHLKNLTGHSVVDGVFTLAGSLRKPDTIEVSADISRITFDYLFISLQNDGPVQFAYRHNEIRIAQARLHGPNTDFHFSGSARFDRERPVHFTVDRRGESGAAERNVAGDKRAGTSQRERRD